MKNKLLLLTMGFALATQIISAQVPSYVPTNGLSGWWGFSGNAKDASVNANNGIVNGATLTTDRFGNPNSAYTFDGISNFINVANSASLSPTNSISMCAWVKIRSIDNFDRVINKSHNIEQNYSTYQLITGNAGLGNAGLPGVTLRFGTGNSQLTNDYIWSGDQSGNKNFDIWQFIVGTWDGSTMNFYQNGILISTQSKTGLLNYTNGDLQFGKGLGGTGLPQFYKGEIDDIGIWNRALTQEEITAMYNGVEYSETCNAVSGSLVDGLVAYYPFCGNAKDASGNSNNGTVNGATLTTDRFGNTNTAYSFNGTDNYISTNPLTLKSFSLSAWIYNTSVNPLNLNGIISNLNAIPYEGIEFRVDDDSTLQLVCGLATDWSHSTTTFKLQDNTWYNIIATSDNSTVKIYVNSQQIASYSISNFTNNTSNLLFGTRNPFASNGGWYTGKIDDIGIWNRALSQVEISNLYNSNICYQNITVNDTLVINTGILSYNPVTYNNTVTIYPNPANDKITIDCGNLDNVNGWSIKIFNTLGQEVFSGVMNTQKYVTPLNTWGGQGIYFVKIYDASNNLMNTKKIILN